jgi:nitrite reductase (NADH) small subunit
MTQRNKIWIDIGALNDVPVRGARVVKTAHGCIGIFRCAENEAYAIEDRCPHSGGPLSEGLVHSASVTCPLHNWVIDLATGEAQGADCGRVKTYPLKLEDGRILIDAAALNARRAA